MTRHIDLNRYDQYLKQNHFTYWLALKHHFTHRKERLNFETHKFLKAIYLDDNPYMVIIKSTQCGITEYLIVRSMAKAIKGKSIFYVLPTYQLVTRVNRNRIDKTISSSAYYKNLEMMVKEANDHKRSDSMTLRDIGTGVIAYVGSNSTAGFTEFPADEVLIDELDECDQDNIAMAWERMSASQERTQIKVANPTIESYGIDAEWSESNQMHWTIKHDCGKHIVYDWFEQAVEEVKEGQYLIRDKEWEWGSRRDINLICQHCGKIIQRDCNGEWVPMYQNRDKHGYHISKLFSSAVTVKEIMDRFNEGLVKPVVLQRFYNADLGMAFTAKGAKITKDMLDDIRGDYVNAKPKFGIIGIDVGNVLNVIIGDLLPGGEIKVCYIGEVTVDIEELRKLMRDYNVKVGVIDALPEQHFVQKVKAIKRNMFSCYYSESKREPVDRYRNVVVSRTTTMDAVKESVLTGGIFLPMDADNVPRFYDQMQASTRVFNEKLNKERGAYEWVHSRPDHFHHAMNYLCIAKKLVIAMNKK